MRSLGAAFVALASCALLVQPAYADAGSLDTAPKYRAEVINPTFNGGLRVPGSDALLIWGTDGAIWRSEKPGAWTRAITQTDADLRALGANADGSVLIAVGDRGAILRSTDQGQHWSTIARSVTTHDLRAVIHHMPGDVWIAVGAGATILRSCDGGLSWDSAPMPLQVIFETLASYRSHDTLLIGGQDGFVGYSKDRGESWHLAQIDMPGERTPIARFHRIDDDVVVGTSAYGRIVVSQDRGKHWKLVETRARGFFTSGTVARGTLWLATHTGELWRSTDKGEELERVQLGLPRSDRYISAVHHDVRTNSIILLGHGGLLARSRDGTQWQEVGSPPANLEVLVVGARGRHVASGAGGLIMEAADAKAPWEVVEPALHEALREVAALPNTSTFVAVGSVGAIVRSTDRGKTWNSVDVRYPNTNTPPTLRALHFEPATGALLTAGPPGTIMRSLDAGASWRFVHWTPLETEEAFPWLLEAAHARTVIAIEARGAFYRTHDAGVQWTRVDVPTSSELWHGATLLLHDVSVAAGQKGAAAVSRDRGMTWRAVETGVAADLYGSFADEQTAALFLVGEGGTLLRSSDAGMTWQQSRTGVTSALRRMIREPRSGTLLAFGAEGAIVRSRDGVMWQAVHSGTKSELRKGLIEPNTGNVILIGAQGVATRSSDAGLTWQAIATNTRRHLRGAAIDDSGNLVAVGERIVRLVRTDESISDSMRATRW